MKISFYVSINKGGEVTFELREFEVDGALLNEINEIAQARATKSDAALLEVSSLLMIGDDHFVFDHDNLTYLNKVKSMLLSEDDDQLNATSLLEPSQGVPVEQVLELDEIASELIANWHQQFAPIAAIANDPYRNVEMLKTFPEVLARCVERSEQLQSLLAAANDEMDFSNYPLSEIEREAALKAKLASFNALLNVIKVLTSKINAIKTSHLQVMNGNPFFSQKLGDVNINELNAHYLKLLSTLADVENIISNYAQQVKEQTKKIKTSLFCESIIIRTWYASENDADQREMFGIPSGGHTTVELCKNEDERIYLGFYVVPDKKRSKIAKAFKKIGLPSPDPGKGYFVDLASDDALVGPGKRYARCETVVIKCNRPGVELNFADAYAWAQQTLARYPAVMSRDGTRKIRMIDDYQFYNNNCASFGAEALRRAGAHDHLRYAAKTIAKIDTPTGVREYAVNLEEILKNKAEIAKREAEVIADIVMMPQEKYFQYVKLAVERLRLYVTDQNRHILQSLIDSLEKSAGQMNRLKDEEVNNFVNALFGSLCRTVNDIGHLENENQLDGAEEIILVLKRLSMLMPRQATMLLDVLNTTTVVSLARFNILHANDGFGVFGVNFYQSKQAIDTVVNDNAGSLVDKMLGIRLALIKLAKLRNQARKNYRKEYAKEKNRANRIQLTSAFKQLENYYSESFRLLTDYLGELRQELYFKPNPIGVNSVLLDSLRKSIASPDIQLGLPVIMQTAKSDNHWSSHDGVLDQLSSDDQRKIFVATASRSAESSVKKPNIFAFWNWGKRHQHFEIENKAHLFEVINDQKSDWTQKLQQIEQIVNDNKPGILKFWRRGERHRYDAMGARAAVICLVDAFSQGKLSETRLSVELEKFIPMLAEPARAGMMKFSRDLITQYQAHVGNPQSAESSVTHSRLLKKILKSTANSEKSYGDLMDDMRVRLFAAHHYDRLKNPDEQPHQEVVEPADLSKENENVAIETSLWRQIRG